MAIKHNSSYVPPGNFVFPGPTEWNASHNALPENVMLNSGNVTWTNMPLALTELFGNVHRRIKVDLAYADEIRLACRVSTAGVVAAVLYAQYSTNESSWLTLTTNQIGLNSIATKVTAWEAIPIGAQGDVFVRIVGSGGDGAADPILGNIYLQVR